MQFARHHCEAIAAESAHKQAFGARDFLKACQPGS
jgi:hypothetical protein